MASDDYIKALRTIEKERGIPQGELVCQIEAALAGAYKRTLSNENQLIANVRAEVNEKGYKVFCKKQISLYIDNPFLQISIDDAAKIDKNATLGDWIEVEVTPANFGRIAANKFRQVINQRINESEKDIAYNEFTKEIGNIVYGKINRKDEKDGCYIVDFGKVDGILHPIEQIKAETLSVGSYYKFYLLDINREQRGIPMKLSRTHPGFIKKLFENEVPEINDGTVEIVSIIREAGSRTKMSVKSKNGNIEPLGACIGFNGSRIQSVLDEINGEKIDIIAFDKDPAKYITNALAPSVPKTVEIDESEHHAKVTVPKKQLSLAIGKNGQNVRLAAKLTTWKIDIIPEED